MKPICFSLGVNPAGTTLVAKTIQPDRLIGGHAPEFFLSELERKPEDPQEVVGEMTLRLLRIYYPAEFGPYDAPTPPKRQQTEAECADEIVSLAPADNSGRMRDPRIAVGIRYGHPVSLYITTMIGTKPTGETAKDVVLDRLAEFPTQQAAWTALGYVVLHWLATLHPDVFAPFPRLAGVLPPCEL